MLLTCLAMIACLAVRPASNAAKFGLNIAHGTKSSHNLILRTLSNTQVGLEVHQAVYHKLVLSAVNTGRLPNDWGQ